MMFKDILPNQKNKVVVRDDRAVSKGPRNLRGSNHSKLCSDRLFIGNIF